MVEPDDATEKRTLSPSNTANPAAEPLSGWRVFRRVLAEMHGHWARLWGVIILGIIVAPLALLQPLALKIAFDNYLGEQPLPRALDWLMPSALANMDGRFGYLLFAAFMIIAASVIVAALNFVKKVWRSYTKEHLVLGLRERLVGHIEKLSLSYHDEEGSSEPTFRVMMDASVIPSVLLDGLIPTLQSLALVIAIATAIIVISWKLALVAVCVVPFLLIVSWPFGRKLRRQWHEVKEYDTSLLARLQEVFSAVRLVKAFGKEHSERNQLLRLAETGMWAKIRVTITQAKFAVLNKLITAVGTATFVIYGTLLVKRGDLQIGDLIMLAALMLQFFAPLQMIVGQIASLQSSFASAERAIALLDQAPGVIDKPDAKPLERAAGHITFENVSFAYEAESPVLHGVSLDIESGTRIGIAGKTGAGKTTLMNLLTRLWDPTEGRILLDGVDLRDLKLDSLREQFSIVLQEPVLFRQSVASNINYARPGASMEETIEAARLANAHDFVDAMPGGYDTIVGERGQRLSGGERQRISLARAFLKDAPLLILDEPTSSVDVGTEAMIMDAAKRLMQGRTTFIIAHRLSTLEFCDKVLVLDGGRVVAYEDADKVGSIEALITGGNAKREGRDAEKSGIERRP